MRRFPVTVVLLCSLLFSVAAAAANDGLVIGLTMHAGTVEQTSASTVDHVPAQRAVMGEAWTLRVNDTGGLATFERVVTAPRQHHGGASDAVQFAIVVPRVAAGSRIVLSDANGVVRWTREVDAALLSNAEATAKRLDAQTRHALSKSTDAHAPQSGSALARQIAASRAQADARAMQQRNEPASVSRTPVRTSKRDNGVLQHGPASPPAMTPAATAQVQLLHNLEGSVTEKNAIAKGAFVVARDAQDAFAGSTHTDEAGNYVFRLPAGQYRVSAYSAPNVELSVGATNLAYPAPAVSEPVQVDADKRLPPLALPEASGTLTLKARMPCRPLGDGFATVSYRGVLRIAGPGGRHVERLWRMNGAPTAIGDSGECNFDFTTALSTGTYSVSITLPGWPERALGNVTIENGTRHDIEATFAAADRDGLWQPQLRYADGTPAAGVMAVLYDETQRGVIQFQSGSDGRLTMPWTPGWGAELYLPDGAPGTAVRRTVQFGVTPPPDTVTFDQVAVGTSQEGDLQRVFGNGDRARRYNILFVAEGYTDARETFEDRNGNGIWDGVLWIDVNGDGVYQSDTDWAQTYGKAPPPQSGKVPDADNEPFIDLNGDGVLSLDDRALFIENTHVFMRSLLGADFWSEQRDMFNAYALFMPSPQAGFDVVDEDQETLLFSRNTLYGAGVELDRHVIVLDRDAAILQGLEALPDVDIVVVLVNQPVPAGRANVSLGGSGPGVMVYYGGVAETSPNGNVQSHEMGHFVGALCDEYDEFPGQHPENGLEGPGCANSSFRHEREHLPWGDLVAADTPLPTLDIDGSTSAFIGSSYYEDGAFRPTLNSTMRYNSPFFNEPSRRVLAAATCDRTGGDLGCDDRIGNELHTAIWWDPAELGWGLFTVDQGNVLTPGWFTNDLDGEPTWFLVPGALPQPDGSYRGDIMRYTGAPFAQGAGNAIDPPTRMGDATLVFEGRDRLKFTYAVGATTRTRHLARFVYGNRDIVCRAATTPLEQATQYSDLWWAPDASGGGLFIAHVGDTLFTTWYTFDSDREAVFMVGTAVQQADGSYAGPLMRQRNGTPYPQIDGAAASAGADPVGSVELKFDNGNAGTFGYTLGEASGTHAITRLRFGDTAGICTATLIGNGPAPRN